MHKQGFYTAVLSAGPEPHSNALLPGSFQDWTLLSLTPVQTQGISMDISDIRQLKLAPPALKCGSAYSAMH